MPIFHSESPPKTIGHSGEISFYEHLESINYPELEVWNSVNLPGVPDIDFILYEPESGLFLTELKSNSLDNLISLGNGEFEILDSQSNTSKRRFNPVKQVKNQQIQLMSYLNLLQRGSKRQYPFIQTTILWNVFSKNAFLKKFPDEANKNLAERMIFADDIVSPSSLKWRLEKLREFPLLGTHVGLNRDHTTTIAFFRDALDLKRVPELSEQTKRELSRQNNRTNTYVERYKFSNSPSLQIFSGQPGTGKTTILRAIGVEHANAGAAVLYLCYNKVLAAEQRREIRFLLDSNKNGSFEAFDIWDYVRAFNSNCTWEYDSEKNLELLKEIELFTNLEYDTILIDEAQDLPNFVFDMVPEITKRKYSFFVANGPGQEQYSNVDGTRKPQRLVELMMNEKNVTPLRRKFRNAPAPFLIAQAFYECVPDQEAGINFLEKNLKILEGNPAQMALEFENFERNQELLIEIVPHSDFYKDLLREIVLREINLLADRGNPLNLLISIGNSFGSYQVLIEVLNELKIPYIDYYPQGPTRRQSSDLVKITTHVNSRGLTSESVLILDFERVQTWIEEMNSKSKLFPIREPFVNTINNLGYIVLSRAKRRTVIVLDPSRQNDSTNFLLKMYYWIKQNKFYSDS